MNDVKSFCYDNSIDGLSEHFKKRSNSIANTYLTGIEARTNAMVVEQLNGALVCLACRNMPSAPSIGMPLPQSIFENIAYHVKMVYTGQGVMLGVVTENPNPEFVVQSANWIGRNFYFSILKRKEEIQKGVDNE